MGYRPKTWLAAVATVAALALMVSPQAGAQLEEFEIFIEINDTDGDAGIQLFLDGEGWDAVKMWDPDYNRILDIRAKGGVGLQGLTEAFFESAEPSFDEQPLADFLALFPEGEYRVAARSEEGVFHRLTAELTHILPDAPILVTPVEEDEEVDPNNTVIEWMPVPDPPGSEIVDYEVIVEVDDDEAEFRDIKILVGPETTSVSIPPEFMQPGTAYKFEVIAREDSGNKTISEREFETDDEE